MSSPGKSHPSAKTPNKNRTQNMLKNFGITKEKSQFSTLKANEIFLDAWSKIPDQSLPVSQLTTQHLANKFWYRENSVPIAKCPTGPACLSLVSTVPKQFSGLPKKTKSPYLSPREEKMKTDNSKNETDNGSETLAKSGVHPKIPEYSNGIHLPNDGFVSRQERAKSTLEKIMRKRIFESERYKNGGVSPSISENLGDCKTNFIMNNIQPITHRGQCLRTNKPPRMNFQERLILGKTSIKLNIPHTVTTCLTNFKEQPPCGITYKDLKMLPLPSPKDCCAMEDSHFARKILGSGRFIVKNHWKPGLSHMKITWQ